MASPLKLVQYIIVRRDLLDALKWPTGAVIAQACHACTAIIHQSYTDEHTQMYLHDLDNMHKVVLEANNQEELENVAGKLKDNDIVFKLWVEQPENIPTCLAIKPYPKDSKKVVNTLSCLFESDMISRRIFSGIQPTGVPHLGNYLGAIKHWVDLQNGAKKKEDVMFCVVDLHSCTTPSEPKLLNENILNMVASLLACGIDPKRSLMFQQSQVHFHTELAWFLGCLTSIGQLNRMHQWKSKKSKERDENNLGLFSYPVLMASDVLLYKATHVPVGEDQVQHMELTRDIATSFNKRYNVPTFPLPEAILTQSSRIMSLRNPNDKMSKSNPNEKSRIDLNDDVDVISSKIKKAVTDSERYISCDITNRHGVKNLISILSAFTETSVDDCIRKYEGVEFFTRNLKSDVTDVVEAKLKPIRGEFYRLVEDKQYLVKVLDEGSSLANTIAEQTMQEVYRNVGMR